MFDRNIIMPRSVNVDSHTTITEKRAPTDESVRLLKEMQQQAVDSVLAALSCKSNAFNFKALIFQDYAACFEMQLRIQFNLNEKHHDHTIKIPESFRALDKQAWIMLIRDEIAKVISGDIVIDLFRDDIFRSKLAGLS